MNRFIKLTLTLLLIAAAILSTACGSKIDTDKLWQSATYTEDTALGEGSSTVKVSVVAGEKSVSFTVSTDKPTLGEALFELGLINDPSFFDTCNGIKADWEKDQAYWSFCIGDDPAPHGAADPKSVTTGELEYKLIYTK